MTNFITNSATKYLEERLCQLLSQSIELKFLVGFFYFSGLTKLYESLTQNPHVKIRILVGLNVDRSIHGLIEYDSGDEGASDEEKRLRFFASMRSSINTEYFDNREFYKQVSFFLELIKQNRLIIRKTYEPNHAKLYIFKLGESQVARNALFITGSSNLTSSGLTHQHEFNVEISDYGVKEAEDYFEELWERAVRLTEDEETKHRMIEVLTKETLIRETSPFEAYALVLKTYLESFRQKKVAPFVTRLLTDKGYTLYKYQIDAVEMALSVIEKHNGVLIADVVGLGKTIIACLVAKHLRASGVVISPPGLVGSETTGGWKKYVHEFGLYDWEVFSLGDLEKTLKFVKTHPEIEVIVVDEAHRLRNQDTRSYELLKNICRNKKVILLTATPFNNKPEDVLALLSLFLIPKKSTITLDSNITEKFRTINFVFDRLVFIRKYVSSPDSKKRELASQYYKTLFHEERIDFARIKREAHRLARYLRDVIEPITVRRNRLDLVKNPLYKEEVKDLSKVEDPREWFYELTPEQAAFYDEILTVYFKDVDEGGRFAGAIYRPFQYEEGYGNDASDEKKDAEKNREFWQQRNLFDFMRRLLVKRFESSFGACEQSLKNFKHINEMVLAFITKTGGGDPLKGEYILDRDLLESIVEETSDEIEEALTEYEKQIRAGVYPKKHKRYKIAKFKDAERFIADIKSDIALFDEVLERLKAFRLIENDPKAECLFHHIAEEISKPPHPGEPKRKIVIFSEYADTVTYLHKKLCVLRPELAERTLVVTGSLPLSKVNEITKNFDASVEYQEDKYDILLTTDKLSEGFNLNRAGMVINYDIPWNPVRVIQRLGRINRISKKVFEKLFIVNFFPTEKGAQLVRSREIAQNKMFMIHNSLGEDAKIFDADEEPSPAKLYQRLVQNPEEREEESFYTKVLNLYLDITKNHPDIAATLSELPRRLKVVKPSNEEEMIVTLVKNGRMYIKTLSKQKGGEIHSADSSLEFVLEKIQCDRNEKALEIDEDFWTMYSLLKREREISYSLAPVASNEDRALLTLRSLIQDQDKALEAVKSFLKMLREDILDYGTLPEYTIRRIANLSLEKKMREETLREISRLQEELGDDYLEKEKQRLTREEKELIVAIMNKQVTDSLWGEVE